MSYLVFISHSSKDKATADVICAMLEERGLRCWIAPRDVTPGMPYPDEIIDGIDASKVMILIVSGHSVRSQHVSRELERAGRNNINIVPFCIENVPLSKTMEYFINATHRLDAWSGPLDTHLQRLAQSVRVLMPMETAHGVTKPGLATVPGPSESHVMLMPAQKVQKRELAAFFRQFADLLRTQRNLGECLRILQQQTTHPALRWVVDDLRQVQPSGGMGAIGAVMASYPQLFENAVILKLQKARSTDEAIIALARIADLCEQQADGKAVIVPQIYAEPESLAVTEIIVESQPEIVPTVVPLAEKQDRRRRYRSEPPPLPEEQSALEEMLPKTVRGQKIGLIAILLGIVSFINYMVVVPVGIAGEAAGKGPNGEDHPVLTVAAVGILLGMAVNLVGVVLGIVGLVNSKNSQVCAILGAGLNVAVPVLWLAILGFLTQG